MRLFSRLLLVFALVCAGFGVSQSANAQDEPVTYPVYFPIVYAHYFQPQWNLARVDAPRTFGDMGNRAIAWNPAQGGPCVAYGNDHLYLVCQKENWAVAVADPADGVGRMASLAFDAAGQAHVAYYDETNGALRYALRTAAGWSIQTVDSPASATGLAYPDATELGGTRSADTQISTFVSGKGGLGGYPSLAVDSSGAVHIAYYDYTNGDLRYTVSSPSGWQTQIVDAAGDSGRYASLALNAAGQPRVAYLDATRGVVRYAAWDGATWQYADAAAVAGQYISLGVKSNGAALIAYYDAAAARARVAVGGLGGFSIETPWDYAGGEYTSLVVSAGGTAVLSFQSAGDPDLMYVIRNAGGGWNGAARLDSRDNVGRNTSVAVSPAGQVWVSYYHSSNNELRVISPGNYGPAALDISAWVGDMPSLIANSSGSPWIAYNNDSQDQLRLAQRSSAWLVSVLDGYPNRDTGVFPSLAMEPSGQLHISFWQYDHHLQYTRSGTNWGLEVIDSGGGVSMRSSLAVDGSGVPNIAYYDQNSDDLKYTYRHKGEWFYEKIDSSGDVGDYPAIAVDANGAPAISYYDRGNGRIKVARWTWRISGWEALETLDGGAAAGLSSIAYDAAGQIHVAYLVGNTAPGGATLRYAVRTAAGWVFETVQTGLTAWDGSLSLKVDSSGQPHISYYAAWPHYDLKYAIRLGSEWQTFTVDSAGDVGSYSSLALYNNAARIAYFDATNGDLKYAELR